MELEYFESGDLDRETIDKLWDVGVCMDDWDFLIISRDLDRFELVEQSDEYEPNKKNLIWVPKSWYLNRILENGCCNTSEWKKIQWKGNTVMIGITYHS